MAQPRSEPETAWVVVSHRLGRFIAGIVTLVTIAGFGLGAFAFYVDENNPFRQREYGYSAIAPLHAGNTEEFFREQLGVPTSISPIFDAPDLNELVFLKDEFAVTAVTNETGRVLLYSVLACNPAFTPTINTPTGSSVQLHTRSLATAELASDGTVLDRSEVEKSYIPAASRTSPGIIIEVGSGSQNPDGNFTNYFVGVNMACDDVVYSTSDRLLDLFTREEYLREFAQEIGTYRESHTANFYAEIAEGSFSLSDNSCIAVDFSETGGSACLYPTVLEYELPPEFLAQKSS